MERERANGGGRQAETATAARAAWVPLANCLGTAARAAWALRGRCSGAARALLGRCLGAA
eukprot:7439675-Lingulodinium_polyedra.AAC.1